MTCRSVSCFISHGFDIHALNKIYSVSCKSVAHAIHQHVDTAVTKDHFFAWLTFAHSHFAFSKSCGSFSKSTKS